LKVPKTLIVELTNYCPFNCPHCYIKKFPKKFLTRSALKASLKKIKDKKDIKKIILHGGEPFVVSLEKTRKIVNIIRKDLFFKKEIFITSNPDCFFNSEGFKERLSFLIKNKMDLSISLDKYRKFWKNKKEASSKLAYMKKNGVKPDIIVTLIKNTDYSWLLGLLKNLIDNDLINNIAWEREIPILPKNKNSYLNHFEFFELLEKLMRDFVKFFGKSSITRYFPFFLAAKKYKIIPMIGCSPFCIKGNIIVGVDGSLSSCTKNQEETKLPFKKRRLVEDICKNCEFLSYCKSRCLWLSADDGSGECIAGRNHIPWNKLLKV